jgi:hypothetical protein
MWSKPKTGGSNSYLKLNDGANRVRIVSEPIEDWEHFVDGSDGKKKVMRCAGRGCSACQFGGKARKVYHFAAVSREGNAEVKLLTVGQMVYGGLYDLMTNEDWRFDSVPDYDITITKKGEGMNTDYSVQSSAKKPLTPEEIELVKAYDMKAALKERYEVAEEKKSEVAPF